MAQAQGRSAIGNSSSGHASPITKDHLPEESISKHLQFLIRGASNAWNSATLALAALDVASDEKIVSSTNSNLGEPHRPRHQKRPSREDIDELGSSRKSKRIIQGDSWDGEVCFSTSPQPSHSLRRSRSGELKCTSSGQCSRLARTQSELAPNDTLKQRVVLTAIRGGRRNDAKAVESHEKHVDPGMSRNENSKKSCPQESSGPSPDEPVVCQVACQSWAGRKNGAKKPNQDAYSFLRTDDRKSLLFGVFDGHGPNGQQAASFVKKHLPAFLMKQAILLTSPSEAFRTAFPMVNKCLEPYVECSVSGTTALMAQVFRRRLTVAWTGDSRAVLARTNENGSLEALPLTEDHKPDNATERQRIVDNDGRVDRLTDQHGAAVGPYRVWLGDTQLLGLAMSRSLGDGLAHSVGVICEPEVHSHELQEADKFLILATDGIWEWISNEEAVQIVGSTPSLEVGCKKLMQAAKIRWQRYDMGTYMDDITAMVIGFTHRQVDIPDVANRAGPGSEQLTTATASTAQLEMSGSLWGAGAGQALSPVIEQFPVRISEEGTSPSSKDLPMGPAGDREARTVGVGEGLNSMDKNSQPSPSFTNRKSIEMGLGDAPRTGRTSTLK